MGLTLLDDFPIGQHHHPRREVSDEVIVVRGHHERASAACQLHERLAEIVAARRIERRGRLVEQQQRRIDRQRAGNGDALRFAARQLARQRRRAVTDAKLIEQRLRRALSPRASARRCTCIGASVTLSIAERCSKR